MVKQKCTRVNNVTNVPFQVQIVSHDSQLINLLDVTDESDTHYTEIKRSFGFFKWRHAYVIKPYLRDANKHERERDRVSLK